MNGIFGQRKNRAERFAGNFPRGIERGIQFQPRRGLCRGSRREFRCWRCLCRRRCLTGSFIRSAAARLRRRNSRLCGRSFGQLRLRLPLGRFSLDGDAVIGAQRFSRERLELLQARQFIDIAKSKAHQEFL